MFTLGQLDALRPHRANCAVNGTCCLADRVTWCIDDIVPPGTFDDEFELAAEERTVVGTADTRRIDQRQVCNFDDRCLFLVGVMGINPLTH